MKQDARLFVQKHSLNFDVFTGLCWVTDVAVFVACGFGADLIYVQAWPVSLSDQAVIGLAAFLATIFHHQLGVYRFERLERPFRQTARLFLGMLGAFLVLAAFGFSTKTTDSFSRGWVLAWFALAVAAFLVARLLIFALIKRGRRAGWLIHNVIVLGANKTADRFIKEFQRVRDPHALILGIFDNRREKVPEAIRGVPVLGAIADIKTYAQTWRIDEVVIALPSAGECQVRKLINEMRPLAADVHLVLGDSSFAFPNRPMKQIAGVPMLNLVDHPVSNWQWTIKLLEDKVLAAFLLLLFIIPMGLIAILIKLDDPGEVLFKQKRMGLNLRPFDLYKFRTMYSDLGDYSGERQTQRNDVRVTRIGRILRRWSLDELPQIFNVLKGDMSLIGPRPHALASKVGNRPFETVVARYEERHRTKPGMTGLAQVKGWRGPIDNPEQISMRVRCDLDYIENWSLLLDLQILVKTIWVVLRRENAY